MMLLVSTCHGVRLVAMTSFGDGGWAGVSWNALVKKWSAVKKTKDGLSRYLGCYQDELDAALAYDR